jgi:hypothetical protein
MSFQNNVAANIGPNASTFHKKLSLKQGAKRANCILRQKFKHVKYIFIDEVQQTPAEVAPYMVELKKMGIIFYCAGDFDQWDNIKNPFTASAPWLKLITDNKQLTLTVNYRNPDMAQIYEWQIEQVPQHSYKTRYYITYYNKTADEINEKKYSEPHENTPYLCTKGSKGRFIKGMHYILQDGLMCLDPCFHAGFIGHQNTPSTPEILAEFFTLGFAFTCHKSIGLTINAPYTIVRHTLPTDTMRRFDYVARSRCTSRLQLREMQLGQPPATHDTEYDGAPDY